jgi:hypothetical protein
VSKERARRRAEREALREAAAQARARVERRRARRRALLRRIRPTPGGRRAWLLARRSPGQRAAAIGFFLAALAAIWYLVGPMPLRIGATLLLILMLPVLVVVIFDRRM